MNDVQLEDDENSQIYNHSDSDLNEDNTQKKSEGMRKWLPNWNFEQSVMLTTHILHPQTKILHRK